jgi:hypothetical protein
MAVTDEKLKAALGTLQDKMDSYGQTAHYSNSKNAVRQFKVSIEALYAKQSVGLAALLESVEKTNLMLAGRIDVVEYQAFIREIARGLSSQVKKEPEYGAWIGAMQAVSWMCLLSACLTLLLVEVVSFPLFIACIIGFVAGYFGRREAQRMQKVDDAIEASNQSSVDVKPEHLIVRPMSMFVVNFQVGEDQLLPDEDIKEFARVAP